MNNFYLIRLKNEATKVSENIMEALRIFMW